MRLRQRPRLDAGTLVNERPGTHIRAFVFAFLGFFMLTGLLGMEIWPATGWRLYSTLRHEQRWGWDVVAVGGDGVERSIPFRELPAAYHGVTYFLAHFGDLSPAERESACTSLGAAARAGEIDVEAVRLYQIRTSIPTRPGEDAGPPHKVPRYECVVR